MTEAELAAIEALFMLGTASEQQHILENAVEWMHGNEIWTFDQAFLAACEKFRVPEEFLTEHREEIDRARRVDLTVQAQRDAGIPEEDIFP